MIPHTSNLPHLSRHAKAHFLGLPFAGRLRSSLLDFPLLQQISCVKVPLSLSCIFLSKVPARHVLQCWLLGILRTSVFQTNFIECQRNKKGEGSANGPGPGFAGREIAYAKSVIGYLSSNIFMLSANAFWQYCTPAALGELWGLCGRGLWGLTRFRR